MNFISEKTTENKNSPSALRGESAGRQRPSVRVQRTKQQHVLAMPEMQNKLMSDQE